MITIQEACFLCGCWHTFRKSSVSNTHYQRKPLDIVSSNHDNKAIVYANTLGRQVPEGLLDKLNRFMNAVYKEDTTGHEMVICQNSKFTVGGKHSCRPSCAMNYPVQTSLTVHSAISMVMAAVATHKPDLFLKLISR